MNDLVLRFDIIDAMEKSIGGRERRILGGIAAGTTTDFQEERFLMKGMDFSYLSSPQGKVNWDHNPRLIIGKPISVGMTEKGLYVKGMLSERNDFQGSHPDTMKAMDIADWAWDHAKRNMADPVGVPPLAWSVEGKKMNQGGMIVKSIVTDVALTDKAVNPNDCTVKAMAKSLREQLEMDAKTEVSVASGLSSEEIDHELSKISSHENLLKFGKSIGLQVDQTIKLYHIMRGLNG
jgi:hypothetical protein